MNHPSLDPYPLVSAIITTYNRRDFLREALQSVLAQDYPNLEVVVIDDGSDDGSFLEVRELPVRYLWQPNRGISSARNRGLTLVRGEYVAFLDADDLWHPRKITTQVRRMIEENAVLSYTDEAWIRNGRRVNQRKRHAKYSGHIFNRCLPLCIISPSSVLMGRGLVEEAGGFDESLPACEDYDLWLRVTARYPVLFIDEALIVKRGGHADQLSRKYPVMDQFRIKAIVKVLDADLIEGDLREQAVRELCHKCRIVGEGALKRGRADEARSYRRLAARYTEV
jgi:glycosyltransferase involved in cell wall biosynthesis